MLDIKVPFFQTTIARENTENTDKLLAHPAYFGSRFFSAQLTERLEERYKGHSVFLTKSGTQALELAALAIGIQPGDEVIMPSFAFVGCANAFILRGARCVFVDIEPGTMNIDSSCIERAITSKTKAILTLNYAGVSCDYEEIIQIAKRHNIPIVEDNAHGIGSSFGGRHLGTFGDYSILSFDYMKPLTSGEGGALLVKGQAQDSFFKKYNMGTNRHEFLVGRSPFYEWKSEGSNYFLSEILSAWLLDELQNIDSIIQTFKTKWDYYYNELSSLAEEGKIDVPFIPPNQNTNGYIFFIKVRLQKDRAPLMKYLKEHGIETAFHYTPLHKSSFGKSSGSFVGEDLYTTDESSRLIRLPLYYSLSEAQQALVAKSIKKFYFDS